jgi:hypothetical protein
MKFMVSELHVKRQTRKTFWIGLLFIALLSSCAVSLIRAEKASAMFLPAIGIFLFAQGFWSVFKKLKEGAAWYPVVEINETAGTLAVRHKQLTVTMPLDQFKALRLQNRSGNLMSVLAKTTSSGEVRFEGYENLDVLADMLKQHVSTDHIKNATLYHR